MKTNKLIENPFLKIISPIYNGVLSIDKCIQSVLNQTFKDWIWFFVDDLSDDGSYEKLLEYERQYPEHIKVFQVTEKGFPGGARNFIRDYPINSKYTYHIDQDDWLANDNAFYEIFKTAVNNNYPDIIYCAYEFVSNAIHMPKISNYNITPEWIVLNDHSAPWKYLIKTSIDNKLKFSSGLGAEDILWFLSLIDNAKTAVFTKSLIYIYNDVSDTSISFNKKVIKKISALKKLSSFIVLNDLINTKFNKDVVNFRKNVFLNSILRTISHNFNGINFSLLNYNEIFNNIFYVDFNNIKKSFINNKKFKDICLIQNKKYIKKKFLLPELKFYLNARPSDAQYLIIGYDFAKNIDANNPYIKINDINDVDNIYAIVLYKNFFKNYSNDDLSMTIKQIISKYTGYIINTNKFF